MSNPNAFLGRSARAAREATAMRERLCAAQREHRYLLEQREAAAREGRDVFPQIQKLFLETGALTNEIERLRQSTQSVVEQGVARLNAENNHDAGQRYIKSRDRLREAVERFREAVAVVQQDMRTGEESGVFFAAACNSRLAEIENVLGGIRLSRVSYQLSPLPSLDPELVGRNQLLTALDKWIGALR